MFANLEPYNTPFDMAEVIRPLRTYAGLKGYLWLHLKYFDYRLLGGAVNFTAQYPAKIQKLIIVSPLHNLRPYLLGGFVLTRPVGGAK